jgi:hypothetical protein
MSDSRSRLYQLLVGGGGAGIGAAIAYELIGVLKSEPKLFIETLAHWGPMFILALVGMVLMDRRAAENLKISEKSAVAQQAMADAVHQIAEKDDRQAEEVRRLASYNAVQTQKVLDRLDAQDEILGQISDGLKKQRSATA